LEQASAIALLRARKPEARNFKINIVGNDDPEFDEKEI